MNQETYLEKEFQFPPPPPPRRPTTVGYEDDSFPPDLTPRQIDILRLAIAGLDNKQISQRLHTSLRNVEKYIPHIQTKIERYSQDSPLSALLKNRS